MQPSEHELRAHFAGLSDEALLQAAASLEELTPLAQDVLRSEVAERRLPMPALEPPGEGVALRNDEPS